MELARLGAELARVKTERDILKKGDGALCKGCTVKYAWIARHKATWPVTLGCEVLEVSTNAYFEHQRRRAQVAPGIWVNRSTVLFLLCSDASLGCLLVNLAIKANRWLDQRLEECGAITWPLHRRPEPSG